LEFLLISPITGCSTILPADVLWESTDEQLLYVLSYWELLNVLPESSCSMYSAPRAPGKQLHRVLEYKYSCSMCSDKELSHAVFENTYFTYFSNFKNMTFYVFHVSKSRKTWL